MYVSLPTCSIVKISTLVPLKIKQQTLYMKRLQVFQANLHDIKMFHKCPEKQFDNKLIFETLETFGIQHSLSMN